MKVVILCGGRGTRLREETEFRPKPMLPIGNRPILWHIMKTYAHHGHKDFILCLGYKGDMIRDYFRNYLWNTCDTTLRLGFGTEASTPDRAAFEQRFQTGFPSGPFDFSHITPAQLDEYLGLLIEERVRRTETLAYLELMHRSVLAYLDGQRDLEKLRAAEQNASAH